MARKVRLKPYEAVDFKNDLGHVIKANDDILIVTTSTGCTAVGVGRYLGLRRSTRYNREEITVLVEYDRSRTTHVHNQTGKEWLWDYAPPGFTRPRWPSYPNRGYHIPWNATPEQKEAARKEQAYAEKVYAEAKAKYDVDYKAYNDAIEAYKANNYKEVTIKYKQRRTLQQNKIYPINMQLRELAA